MMLDYHVEFPCGYKIRLYLRQCFSQASVTDTDLPVCPLHGKDCKSKNSKSKLSKGGKKW